MAAIACVESDRDLHIVRWVGKSGFASVGIFSYCGTKFDGGDGTVQIPEIALMRSEIPATAAPARNLKPCEGCKTAWAKLETTSITAG